MNMKSKTVVFVQFVIIRCLALVRSLSCLASVAQPRAFYLMREFIIVS